MPQFFMADVRKRANADANLQPHANPESRVFPPEAPGAADSSSPEMQDYHRLIEEFSKFSTDTPDEPVACDLAGVTGVTMEWTVDPLSGQIDFYSTVAGEAEPERFLTLYFLVGTNPDQARKLLRPLESYADFSQCVQYPLVLRVIDDPLPAAWQHAALDSVRQGTVPLVAAFLRVYFSTPVPVAS